MIEDVKTRWIEALRSGQYQQGQFYLENDGRYCCLGVLCEIQNRPLVGESGNRVFPRVSFLDEIGLPDKDASELARMNDLGNTFIEIANHIEQKL